MDAGRTVANSARLLAQNRHKRPIASHFHSGGLEFSYLGKDLDEADGEPEETLASIAIRERTGANFATATIWPISRSRRRSLGAEVEPSVPVFSGLK